MGIMLDFYAVNAQLSMLLTGRQFDLTDEKRVQMEIERHLRTANMELYREFRLSPGEIPDFAIPTEDGLVVVEIKVNKKWSKMRVLRQLESYAGHPEVIGVILVTNFAMRLPYIIKAKPAALISLGRAWL